ncbi:DUF397 domain-containing protein [Streptomyces sp. NPDC051366]|uniref:DUF397 domain-containing protein n=1 Tax=Streptomyces sp. NPDC051366 TaxID=3365652 RepID=UPI0037944CA0
MTTVCWRKSSYSNGDGGECVEVGEAFSGAATWRTSSYTNSDGGTCVEVADGLVGLVPVRDSKRPHGPAVIVTVGAWVPFVRALKAGELPA